MPSDSVVHIDFLGGILFRIRVFRPFRGILDPNLRSDPTLQLTPDPDSLLCPQYAFFGGFLDSDLGVQTGSDSDPL